MGCATGLVKYFVFLANLVFALAGLALVIIGVLYKFNYSEATDALPSNFGVAPILSIIIGAIVFVTAFLGCCGAVKESPCMLTTYAIILLVIFIIQVAIGVYAFIKINEDEAEPRRLIHNSLEKTFDGYGRDVKKTEAVDVIQSWFHCCGLDRYDHMILQNGSLPHSCCRDGVSVCRPTNYNSFYDKPCSKALMEFYQKSSPIIGGVAIGIAVIELHCCGLNGPDEYQYANGSLPNSCCLEEIRPCMKREYESYYHNSCANSLYEFMVDKSKIFGAVVLGIALVELFGAFFAFCLVSSVKNSYRRSLYA